jgi:UrcA family protein
MIRSFCIAAAALTLLAATAARAEDVKVNYDPSKLATAQGRAALKSDIAGAAERYCQVNQFEGTVTHCQHLVAEEMNRQLKEHTEQAAAKPAAQRQLTQR